MNPSGSLLLISALAGLFGLSLLVSACGGSSGLETSTTSAGSAALAFSRCMRSHGVPNFPDPDSQGNFPSLAQQALGVSKQTSLAAQKTCTHLLSGGGTAATPQQREQKLTFALKVAQCLRVHGYPNFPDPTASGQQVPPGIDTSSPQFEATETTCEKHVQKELGLR